MVDEQVSRQLRGGRGVQKVVPSQAGERRGSVEETLCKREWLRSESLGCCM